MNDRLWTYYFTRGRYGSVDTSSISNADYIDLGQYSQVDIDIDLFNLRRDIKRAMRAHRNIVLGLNTDPELNYAKKVLVRASKPFQNVPEILPWPRVQLIDLGDEPKYGILDQAKVADEVKHLMDVLNLPPAPVGAVFGYKDPVVPVSKSFDWVGLEAYLEPPGSQYTDIYQAVYAQLERQDYRIKSNHKVIVVIQAYDRNGEWHAMKNLRQLQRDAVTASIKLFGNHLLGFFLFSYLRPGGSKMYPGVLAVQNWLYADDAHNA